MVGSRARNCIFFAVAVAVIGTLSCGCTSRLGASAKGVASEGATSSAQSTAAAPAASAEATATPIRLDQFGSPKDGWHRALVSVTVRTDVLVIRVRKDLSPSDLDRVERAANAARTKLGLAVTQYDVVYDKTGYVLKYGPLGLP
jgi:hypothetical protein